MSGICERLGVQAPGPTRPAPSNGGWLLGGVARSGDRSHQLQPFLANQFRVLLTAAAYVLLQELRSLFVTDPGASGDRSIHPESR